MYVVIEDNDFLQLGIPAANEKYNFLYRKKALLFCTYLSIFDVLIIPKFPQTITVSKVTLMMFTLHSKGVDKIIVV